MTRPPPRQQASRNPPTQKQVAERAGVSQTIVSQVLNGQTDQARIHPETRARVLQAIRDLGYVPNAAARRLVGGRSSLVGVFTYEAVFPSSTRDFYAPFLEGIEEEAARSGLDLLLYTGGRGGRRLPRDLGARLSLTDGTLLLGRPSDQDRRELAALVHSGHPAVFIGRRTVPGADLTCVQADYASATAKLTRRFLARGHRELLYVGPPGPDESALDRERGFAQALDLARVERLEPGHLDHAWLRGALEGGITAFLLENDALMRRLLEVAREAGYTVPADFSAAVLGDAISGEAGDPTWSGLHVPRREMGRGAVQALRLLVAGEPAASTVFPCEIVVGATIGRGPAEAR
ncbi:periplasmic binding protein/LacI transcriptional regulator [Deinococcus phoenicis]|uniref:Periplasmic binding protein/LacI transcriptional regulator n=1 Tax=Deinococcus phoenicis TaxID=1476583 RepID=A0A016QQ70_9DEIO|nr:LacI family DNA-binding transcriptional regulator [Deinococcus phoenicis]EYB68111.1 periplasmic binding protein/LacI transcriptional regulator [Deinococcus phoenicis]